MVYICSQMFVHMHMCTYVQSTTCVCVCRCIGIVTIVLAYILACIKRGSEGMPVVGVCFP